MALSNKQQAFINEYLKCWNATEAAKKAGYSETSARISGSKNMSNANISAEIERRIAEMTMEANEVLIRLGNQARGSIGDFGTVDGDGNFSLNFAKDTADMSLVKKIKHTRKTYVGKDDNEPNETVDYYEFELYDSQSALVHIGKHHGIFAKDKKVEISWRDKVPEGQDPEAIKQQIKEAVSKRALEQNDD